MKRKRKRKRKNNNEYDYDQESKKSKRESVFETLPRDVHIIILSFVLLKDKEREKKFKQISLVSKEWHSVSWSAFYKIIPKTAKNKIFCEVCKHGFFQSALKIYAQEGFLSTQVDPSSFDNCAIRLASEGGHIDIVKLLLQDKRVDPSANVNWAIRMASRNGHIDVVKILLQDNNRVDPSAKNNYAIRLAGFWQHGDIVKLLSQDTRVNPSGTNNCTIQNASLFGYIDVMQLLLQDSRVTPTHQDVWVEL